MLRGGRRRLCADGGGAAAEGSSVFLEEESIEMISGDGIGTVIIPPGRGYRLFG